MFKFFRAGLHLERAAKCAAEIKSEKLTAAHLAKAERLVLNARFSEIEAKALIGLYDRVLDAAENLPGTIPIKQHCEELKGVLAQTLPKEERDLQLVRASQESSIPSLNIISLNDEQIVSLVDDIEKLGFAEFDFDSPILDMASHIRDPRIVRILALRHHQLSNKSAWSAHVLREIIKRIDGPKFNVLWSFIDSEDNAQIIVDRMDDYEYLPWAATYILGEIGGAYALASTTSRLTPYHQSRYYLLIRLLSHIIVRYLQIDEDEVPMGTMIDVNTGEATRIPMPHGPAYERELLKRRQSNEYFKLFTARLMKEILRNLDNVPDSFFNIPKPQLITALGRLPIVVA